MFLKAFKTLFPYFLKVLEPNFWICSNSSKNLKLDTNRFRNYSSKRFINRKSKSRRKKWDINRLIVKKYKYRLGSISKYNKFQSYRPRIKNFFNRTPILENKVYRKHFKLNRTIFLKNRSTKKLSKIINYK